jgi:hypothetical protein
LEFECVKLIYFYNEDDIFISGVICGVVGGCISGMVSWLSYASTYPGGLSSQTFIKNTGEVGKCSAIIN